MIKGEPHLVLTFRTNTTILVLPVAHTFSRCSSHISVFTKLNFYRCRKRDLLVLEGSGTNCCPLRQFQSSTLGQNAENKVTQYQKHVHLREALGICLVHTPKEQCRTQRTRTAWTERRRDWLSVSYCRYPVDGSFFSSVLQVLFSLLWVFESMNPFGFESMSSYNKAMYYSLLPLIGRCCSSPILKDHGEDIRVFFFFRASFSSRTSVPRLSLTGAR